MPINNCAIGKKTNCMNGSLRFALSNVIKKLFKRNSFKRCAKEKQQKALNLLAERMRELRELRGERDSSHSSGTHGS